MKMDRRRFLKISAVTAGGLVVVGGGGAIYAMSRDTDLIALYVEAAQEVFAARFGDDAEIILEDTWQEYETLLPDLPYIGGEENFNTENLLMAAYCLAMYRVLKARGRTIEEVGMTIYETAEAIFGYPKWLLGVIGSLKYGKSYEKQLREQAAESQKRQYAGDWVFSFIEGDGEELDYGLDFTECGICKFYRAQGADELTPYMCLSDYVSSKAFNRGLVRYKTLAEGAEVCDFRYKKGRETFVYPLRDGWPPKFLNEETGQS
jgi:hypothetical protein